MQRRSSSLTSPPADAVPWLVAEQRPDGTLGEPVRVVAQLWYEAKRKGAAKLRVPVERCSAVLEREEASS